MSPTLPVIASAYVAILLLGGGVSTVLADGAGPKDEATLNKQGLESRDQANEGYSALNDAAFALLFDENATVGWFGDNPRTVTFGNAPNKALASWAFDKTLEIYRKREKQREKAERAATPKVRIEATADTAEKTQAFQKWAADNGGQANPAGPVGYDPSAILEALDEAFGFPTSWLDDFLESAAVTDSPDVAPVPLTPTTPLWGLAAPLGVLAGTDLVLDRKYSNPPDYQPARDTITTLAKIPKLGMVFADESSEDTESQLPVLGDVPFLGQFFRRDRGPGESPFVVTVKPRIVRDFSDD